MLSTWLTVLLLLKVQDELSKNFDAEKVLKFILSLIFLLKMSRSFSKFISIISFKTKNNVAWLQQ